MKRLLVLATALLCLLWPSAAFAAYNPLHTACSGSGSGSTACGTNGSDPISGPNGVLEKITLVLATIAGIAAVIVIIIAGFSYITSSGNPQKAESARNAIIGAVIGLVIIAAGATIVTFVVGRL